MLIQLTDVSPTVSIVGSAAEYAGPFTAGELISISGTQLGPSAGSGAQVGLSGIVATTSGGTQVLFDGVAGPILFARADMVNTSIPCALAGHSTTQMIVEYLGPNQPR